MKIKIVNKCILASVFSIFLISCSDDAPKSNFANDIGKEEVLKKLQDIYPDVKFQKSEKSPVPYFYQLISGAEVIYASQDGQYVVVGNVIDLNNNKINITEEVRKASRNNNLQKLGADKLIEFKAKEQKYVVTVFTDIDCPFCRKFHDNISKYNELGITVRYAAFPRAGLQAKNYNKTVSIWCATDKNSALEKAKRGEQIANNLCNNHFVDEQFKTGLAIGVTGTPAILIENGNLLPGFIPPNRLLEILQKEISS